LTGATGHRTINDGKEHQMSSKTKIGLLVAGHIVAGLLLVWFARHSTAAYPIALFGLFALVFAEAGLIGFWGGLSAIRLVFRLLAVLLATLYLWAVFVVALPEGKNPSAFLVIALTAVPILVVLVFLRHSRRRLRLAHLANKSPSSEGFQFSIRHLLLVTALVATVLGIGRGIRSNSGTQSDAVGVATFPPCFIMVQLATLWAALGIGRPIPRLAVVVPMALIVGAIPSFYLPRPTEVAILQLFIWPAIVGLQAIITAASLLVVRSCGWRLVSWGGGQGANLPTPLGP
jgi:hypothetical protein